MARKAPKKNQCLFLLIVIKNGNDDNPEATTAPNPRVTNKVGKAQQIKVDSEVKREKKLDRFCFNYIIFYSPQLNTA